VPHDSQLWQLPLLAAALIVLVYLVHVGIRRSRRAREEEDQKRSEALERARERGEVDSEGNSLCVVCLGSRATEAYPVLRQSRMDRDPFGHRRLHNSTPMYGVDDEEWGEPQLCRPHKRMLVRKMEQKLAQVRSRTSEFNSQVEQELARLESGELLVWARAECQAGTEMLVEALTLRSDRLRLPQNATTTPVAGVGTVTLKPDEDEEEPAEHEDAP
jgi:hypothetical protein